MNEQEQHWTGEPGDEYHARNEGMVPANTAFFARALRNADLHPSANDVIEFGCGTGMNLAALVHLGFNEERLHGVELNKVAAAQAEITTGCEIAIASIIDDTCEWPPHYELAFTKGLLIHIAPEDLAVAYRALHNSSRRYILIAEYYNPMPIEIEYRGQHDRLWKRDFAGEMMEHYRDLRLRDYGFVYRLDKWPQDDLHWFLLEK